jgi:hypothetical protein
MTSIARRVHRMMLAAGVAGTLGFGTATAFAAPPAEAQPFFCGVRATGAMCKNCCLNNGFTAGQWNPDNGNCWCWNPD